MLVGHGGAGKTSLTEALLHAAGAINRPGRVEDGNTVSDFDPYEVTKGISISLSLAPFDWKDHKINLLDAPGYADFVGDAEAGIRAADAAIIVISAVEGLEVQARVAWDIAEHLGIPRAFFINKLDRERASFQRTMDELTETFGNKVAPLHLPIGEEHDFRGVVDLLGDRAFSTRTVPGASGDPRGSFRQGSRVAREAPRVRGRDRRRVDGALPRGRDDRHQGDRRGAQQSHRGRHNGSGAVRERDEGHRRGPACGFHRGRGSLSLERLPVKATKGGEESELPPDADGPLAALVFKTLSDPYVGKLTFFRVYSGTFRPDQTVFNASRDAEERVGQVHTLRGKHQETVSEVPAGDIGALAKLSHTITGDTLASRATPLVLQGVEFPDPLLAVAIEPKTKGDEDKLSIALHKLADEDPTFRHERNSQTHQTLIMGMGEAHLDVIVHRLARHHVEVNTLPPKVAYRETIKRTASAQGRHVKQSGGRGQYAVCSLELSPLPRGAGFEFENAIVGGAIPGNFIPSVEKGARKALEEGVLAGYLFVDVKARLFDGKFHSVDSSDIAFQLAGGQAFKDAAREAGVVLLEPIMDLDVMTPDDTVGDIMGDLSSKRARIEGSEPVGRGWTHIKAKVPQGEVLRYSIDLRSKTGGRATFRVAFSHYEEAPSHVQEKVVAEAQKAKEEAHK